MFPRSLPTLVTCVFLLCFCVGLATGLFMLLKNQLFLAQSSALSFRLLHRRAALRDSLPPAFVAGLYCSPFSEFLDYRAEIVPLSYCEHLVLPIPLSAALYFLWLNSDVLYFSFSFSLTSF